jgi:NAD(P)-dependent dehydrogenase (short-subunit alcohol dehydrogenase family)
MLDSNRLDGKIAVITGAAGDIGAAAARLMAARGAAIVAVDRDLDRLQRIAGDLPASARLLTLRADVTSEADVRGYVERAVAAFGRIDVFFNNAGVGGAVHRLTDYPLAEFEKVLAVNVTGVFLGMKHVIPVMVAQGGGSVINTSSAAGRQGAAGLIAYIASKHAVIGMTRTAAIEWASRGVRVNSVNPGPIEGRMMGSLEDGMVPGNAALVKQKICERIPAHRYGTAEEVATLVAFLASDDARYINGSFYMVDGGFLAT